MATKDSSAMWWVTELIMAMVGFYGPENKPHHLNLYTNGSSERKKKTNFTVQIFYLFSHILTWTN